MDLVTDELPHGSVHLDGRTAAARWEEAAARWEEAAAS